MPSHYRFGPFELDPQEHRLLASGQPVALTRRTFDTLLHLVKNHGRLVGRAELLAAVWGETIVEESNLHWTVSTLRRSLAEHSSEPWIETVRGVGYRFAAGVEIQTEEDAPAAKAAAPAADKPRRRAGDRPLRRFGLPAALVVAALAAWTLLPSPQQAFDQPAVVAVLGFSNLAPDPESNWLSGAVAGLLRAELETTGRLRSVSGERLATMSRDLSLATASDLSGDELDRVRRYLDCDLLITGSYLRLEGAGHPLRLEVRLVEAPSGRLLASSQATGPEADLFGLVSDLAGQLRPALGLSAERPSTDYLMPQVSKARRHYVEGLELARRGEDSSAVERFLAASGEEPEFALVWLELSKSYDRLGQLRLASEAAARAKRLSTGLPELARLSIEANALRQERRWPEAISLYRRIWRDSADPERGLELVLVETSARQRRQALETLVSLRRGRLREDPRLDVLEAEAERVEERFPEVAAAAERAAIRARRLGAVELETRAMLRLADARLRMDGAAARPFLEPLLASIESNLEHLENPALEAQSATLMGSLYRRLAQPAESLAAFERAEAVYREQGARRLLGEALANVAAAKLDLGDLASAERHMREAIATCDPSSEEGCRERFLNPLASNLMHRGRLTEARQLFAESEAAHRLSGNLNRVAEAGSFTLELAAWEGRPEESVEIARQVLALRREAGQPMGVAWARDDLGTQLLHVGRLDEAGEHLEAALAEALRMKAPSLEASVRAHLALLALERGDLSAAEELSAAAYGRLSPPKVPITSYPVWFVRCRVLLARGNLAAAEALIASGTELAAKNGFVAWELEGRLLRAELDQAAGRGGEGRLRARDLAGEARAKGFLSLAARAEAVATRS